MGDRSITMATKTFHCYNNCKHREQRNTSRFHGFYLKIFVASTKFGKQFILNTVVCSCLRLHPIHLENSKGTGLLEKGEVRSLPITASQRNQATTTPEVKTWPLLKAAHTPCLRGTELTRTAPLTISATLLSWSNLDQLIATGALCITMVTMAV